MLRNVAQDNNFRKHLVLEEVYFICNQTCTCPSALGSPIYSRACGSMVFTLHDMNKFHFDGNNFSHVHIALTSIIK